MQQIALKPGTYASDGNNLFKLEDTGNTSSMMNMHMAYPTWQQNNHQTWSPDIAYVQHLACDRHYQTPWVPTYWNTGMANQQLLQQGDVINYNSGYLNNDVYSCYEAFRP